MSAAKAVTTAVETRLARARCIGCGNKADYGQPPPGSGLTWSDVRYRSTRENVAERLAGLTWWCHTCRPRPGRRPGGGEGLTVPQMANRIIDDFLSRHVCLECGGPATTGLTPADAPSLAQLREGASFPLLRGILAATQPLCEPCLRRITGAMGRVAASEAAINRRGLTARRVRQAIEGGTRDWRQPARSENEVLARLGQKEHGSSPRSRLRRLVETYQDEDPTFPALPNAAAALRAGRLTQPRP